MAKNNAEKRRIKRKARQKQRRLEKHASEKDNKGRENIAWAEHQMNLGNYEDALVFTEKALKFDPENERMLKLLADVGLRLERFDIVLRAFDTLRRIGKETLEMVFQRCIIFDLLERYEEAVAAINEAIPLIIKGSITAKQRKLKALKRTLKKDQGILESRKAFDGIMAEKKEQEIAAQKEETAKPAVKNPPSAIKPEKPKALKPIPVSLVIDTELLEPALKRERYSLPDEYRVALAGHQIRFKETFDHIICLAGLKEVRSFWYQEETARKVLKTFRGRALLSDEVGLGKTIEALIVLKEYISRAMIKSALILTPTPLVSQWKEELKSKFELDFPSTDDPDFKTMGDSFWEQPFILASINMAKSKKNFSLVTGREYDMVIVDEAHHLKNKTTLNWKLVNALKKRFLLLLSATPVENNLMELYNLITLLKPGQLKTATEFRKEFMTRGDPTDPRNRSLLKELLSQVMIRNTRAIARINIPPRFARTIKIDAGNLENHVYDRITALVRDIEKSNGKGNKMLLKNLLAEAGSSFRAVHLTMTRMLGRKDFLNRQRDEIQAIANTCKSMGATQKNKMLMKVLKSSPGKMIIFVKYIGTIEELSEFLSWNDIPHCLFHGSMPNREKDEQITLFQESKDVLLTTEIGGEGRNLQFCHQMINYDLPWNPMKIEQRIGRIHRIGQEKEVMIYNFCASGSLEDHILEILDRKINMFEMVIGEIDMILGRIRGEKDFSELVYDIWVNSESEEEKSKSFGQLANRMKRSKTSYDKTKELDDKLFGENYEL